MKDYKIKGHILIDTIVTYGYTKDEVYSILEKKLGHNKEHAHFSKVTEEWQAKVVIKKLEEMLDSARQRYPNRNRTKGSSKTKKKPRTPEGSLTLSEQKEALKKVNNKPAGIWLRIKSWLSTVVSLSDK